MIAWEIPTVSSRNYIMPLFTLWLILSKWGVEKAIDEDEIESEDDEEQEKNVVVLHGEI